MGAVRIAIAVVLFGGTAFVTLHDWLGVGGAGLDSIVNGHLYDSVVVSAGLACLVRAHDERRERAAWLAIAAAVFFWAAAESYWTEAIVPDPSPPYPSPADIGYLAFYPLAFVGVLLLVHARARELDWRLWMDGLIAALGTAALGAALVFEFVADRTSGTTAEVATTLAYPLGDILILALVVGVVALTRWRPGRTWTLLLLGLAAMVVADVAYTLQTTDASLPGGNWIEPIYLLSAVFIGAEAWQPQAATIEPEARFEGWRELMVPGFFAVMMICLFVLQLFNRTSGLTSALWAATMVAVLTRLAISVRQNKRLLEQVRTDYLTGLGNQSRMHADLEARCARAASHPTLLVLFDLNGFKRYNDTFGHPAGDTMLRQLGGRLGAVVADEGVAYRVGGDEFAVLADYDEARRDAVTKRAAEALTSRGRGFDVGASWGAVAIPAEADSAAEAMRLADARMYAQKESRRVTHDDGIEIERTKLTVERGEVIEGLAGPGDGEALEQGN